MAQDALSAHLSALQLSDSGFPSGRYTLSYGLESVVQSGLLSHADGPATLTRLLGDCVRFGVARSDGVALACTHRAVGVDGGADWEQVREADQRLTAVKLCREAREASARTGRALLATASALTGGAPVEGYAEMVHDRRTPGNHAVALGLVSAVLGVPRLLAVVGELYSFCASWAAAAVRLGAVDHQIAQQVLHRVRPVISDAARTAADGGIAQISSCTPFLDVMSMRHEQAELRLFAT